MTLNETSIHVYSHEEVSALVALTTFILVLSVPANILVLLGYLTSPSARRKPSNLLLINMTLSELLTAVIVIPLQLVVHCTNSSLARKDGPWCKTVGVLTYPFYIVTVITMVCISIDRFYAIREPLKYKSKMTAKCIGLMIVYTWFHAATFSFIFGFVVGVGYNKLSAVCSIVWDDHMGVSVFVAATHIVLPFVLLMVLNLNLVASLRKQNRNLMNQLDRELNVTDRVRAGKDHTRQAQERRVAGMVFWIISTYLICWLPILVTRSLQVTPVRSSPLIDAISNLILHLSVVINPMLNLKFRKELRASVKRMCIRRNDVMPIRVLSRSFLSAVDADRSKLNGPVWTQSRS